MKSKVNGEICIGCGACAAICPDVFEINDDGIAFTKDVAENNDSNEDVIEAVESCPTGAIEIENKTN